MQPAIFENSNERQLFIRILLAGLSFLLVTLVIFTAYRAAFLKLFAPATRVVDGLLILLYGMRVDAALVAIELLTLAVLFLLSRWLRFRVLSGALAALTLLHGTVAVANLLFFGERGQHFWEMLLANITRPDEIFIAVWPFLKLNMGAALLGLLFLLFFAGAVRWWLRKVSPAGLDLWKPRHRIFRSGCLIFVLFLANLDPAAFQERKYWRLGWIPLPTSSQLYMRFDSYQKNQAVVNPLHDFIRFYIPATLAGFQGEKDLVLPSDEALALSQTLLGAPPGNRPYPLARPIPPGPRLGLKNVIVIQVEGLSGALIHYQENGQPVTPFLNRLSRDGLHFTNIMQSFNATDGAVLATATSFHKAFYNKNWEYFLPIEVNGYFSSLPHILGGSDYQHLGIHGFENRREDFSAFLLNQGFEAIDLADFEDRLGSRIHDTEVRNALGLFDGVLLQQTAAIIGDLEADFTVHIMTATTHSPWVIPEDAAHPFANQGFNGFHYLDQSIARLVESLQTSMPLRFEETLFVIVADHTSILTGGKILDRLRVPVIFYSPKLVEFPGKDAIATGILGSQVDILPTILQLLDNDYQYPGMGTSLLAQHPSRPGVISSSRYESYYLKDDFAFHYSPYRRTEEKMRLLRRSGDDLLNQDVAGSYPELFEQMKKEYFALYETSSRLVNEKRILPMQ
jgi:phosphoglycerol transferase MdoB-like AlkP superfamily enzyme